MGVRIVFGIMSATQSAAVVDQLAGLLAPHRVVVHHDFEKKPDFRPTAPNIDIVPDPKVTGWGTWGLSEAILHTVRHALDHHEFDYFQLMSPTCLPIRPLEEFEAFVESDPADAHVDLMPVERDDNTLMHFGYRSFAPYNTLRFRLMRRVRRLYFTPGAQFVQTKSLAMYRLSETPDGRPATLGGRFALRLTKLAAGGWLGPHPFGPDFKPMIGGTFFGARRAVCEYLVGMGGNALIPQFVRDLQIVDETLFPTLLANSRFKLGPANHAINDFTEEGNPRWIDDADLDRLIATRRFFARKFVDDPFDPVRARAIEQVELTQAMR
jgi:hypothetical protein